MAKKNTSTNDTADLRKRVKAITLDIVQFRIDQQNCVNQRAHLVQYYIGRIEQAEAELEFLRGLLDQ